MAYYGILFGTLFLSSLYILATSLANLTNSNPFSFFTSSSLLASSLVFLLIINDIRGTSHIFEKYGGGPSTNKQEAKYTPSAKLIDFILFWLYLSTILCIRPNLEPLQIDLSRFEPYLNYANFWRLLVFIFILGIFWDFCIYEIKNIGKTFSSSKVYFIALMILTLLASLPMFFTDLSQNSTFLSLFNILYLVYFVIKFLRVAPRAF